MLPGYLLASQCFFFFMRLSEFFMYQMDWPFHHKIACKIFSLAHLTFTVIWGVSLPVWYLEMLHVRQSKFSVISSLISTSLPRDRSPSPSAWQSGPWWSLLSSPFQKPHLCSPLEAFSSGGWTSGLSSRFGTWRGWFLFLTLPSSVRQKIIFGNNQEIKQIIMKMARKGQPTVQLFCRIGYIWPCPWKRKRKWQK